MSATTHYYLLISDHAGLLVDIGFPGTLPKLRHQLRLKGIALQQITHLLATHYHPDHAGLAQELKDHGVRLVVLEEQLPAVPHLREYMKPSYPFRDITLHDAIVLRATDSRAFLQALGITGEIISTPGHSDDSVTLILDDGAAFTGDLISPLAATDDARAAVEQSWERIRAYHVQRIYPGHGPARPIDPSIS
jgi:ribonuclease/clavin/mitogillin